MNDNAYETAWISLIGDRDLNQDRCAVLSQGASVLLVLADGMGGHPRGELAAQIAMDIFAEGFQRADQPVQDPAAFLREQVLRTHRAINTYGTQQRRPIEPRTTLVAALVERERVSWTHLGDSRLYLLRKGRVVAQTLDHSYVRMLVDQGVIREEESESHPLRNYVTRCLGGLDEVPDPSAGSSAGLRPGDLVLLCSDGFWASLGTDGLQRGLEDDASPLDEQLNRLAEGARRKAHPRSDNVTAVALRRPADPAAWNTRKALG
jgi:serine/threonine protein phosphatase PrpC